MKEVMCFVTNFHGHFPETGDLEPQDGEQEANAEYKIIIEE